MILRMRAGDLDLAAMAAQFMDFRQQRCGRAHNGVGGQARGHQGCFSARRQASKRPVRAQAVENWVPLMSPRPSFGPSTTGVRPAFAKALHRLACGCRRIRLRLRRSERRPYGRAAQDRPRRRPIPVRGSPASHCASRQSSISFSTSKRDARRAAAERQQLQHHHQPGGGAVQRLTDAAAMGQDQIALQCCRVFRCDLDAGQFAEAGIDAIDSFAAARRLATRSAARFDGPLLRERSMVMGSSTR